MTARTDRLLEIARERRAFVEAELAGLDAEIGVLERPGPDLRDLLVDPAGFTDEGLADPVELVSPCAMDHRPGSMVIDVPKAPSATSQINTDPEKYWARTSSRRG